MSERPVKLVFDSDAFVRLEADEAASQVLRQLIAECKIAVLLPRVVQEELRARSAGLPNWLAFAEVADATKANADVLISDNRRCRRRARSSGRFGRALSYEEWIESLSDYTRS